MEDIVLTIKPNTLTLLPVEEVYHVNLSSLLDDVVYSCRIIIQDEHDFGVVLPAEIKTNKEISFKLPEQLCIFNPSKTYILKAEIISEDQLLMPFISQCTIDLKDLIEPEKIEDDQEHVDDSQVLEQPLNENLDKIEDILSIVAPLSITEQKKTKLEELAKTLDEDFVKQVFFNPIEKQKAPVPAKTPKPFLELSPEKMAFKQRMKTLLKGMLY